MNTFKAFIIAMMMIVIAQAKRPKSRLLLASTQVPLTPDEQRMIKSLIPRRYEEIPTKEQLWDERSNVATKFIDFTVNQRTGTWRFFPNGTEIAYYPKKPVVIGPYVDKFEHEKVPLVYLNNWNAGKVIARKEAFDRSLVKLQTQVREFVHEWSQEKSAILPFWKTGELWKAWAQFNDDTEKVIRLKKDAETTVDRMKKIFKEADLDLSEDQIRYFSGKDMRLSYMIQTISKEDPDLRHQMVRVVNAEMVRYANANGR